MELFAVWSAEALSSIMCRMRSIEAETSSMEASVSSDRAASVSDWRAVSFAAERMSVMLSRREMTVEFSFLATWASSSLPESS